MTRFACLSEVVNNGVHGVLAGPARFVVQEPEAAEASNGLCRGAVDHLIDSMVPGRCGVPKAHNPHIQPLPTVPVGQQARGHQSTILQMESDAAQKDSTGYFCSAKASRMLFCNELRKSVNCVATCSCIDIFGIGEA